MSGSSELYRKSIWEDVKNDLSLHGKFNNITVPPSQLHIYNSKFRCENSNSKSIRFINENPIDVGIFMKAHGRNPLVFNVVKKHGWKRTNGLEDGIMNTWNDYLIRTNLSLHLHETLFPLDDDALIYSKDVAVLRMTEPHYKIRPVFERLTFATINDTINESLEKRIKLLFQMAKKHNHQALIFTPIKGDKREIKIFLNVFNKYRGIIEWVIVAGTYGSFVIYKDAIKNQVNI